ncbi:DNA-processing protein DprA [Bermanella sp. R86510]|uniref:DNA-processing protein DprA n=1 Tax=unclassified Bermanella TaxID=2627862 RepID=UPI0037C528AC
MSGFIQSLTFLEQIYIVLATTKGVGPKTLARLMAAADIDSLYSWDSEQFKQCGVGKKTQQSILQNSLSHPSKELEELLAWQQSSSSHHVITPFSAEFPECLKHIALPPPMLTVKGSLTALSLPQVAIVGSRHPSDQAQTHAYEFAFAMANSGLGVASGLATGVDTHAHQGAIDAGGATIAVLGSGLNRIYPPQNKRLAEQLCEKGALVSEFPVSTPPHPGQFPRRNRIVSGLSLGVLVVEAHLKSGSLITARQGLEQNRDVFAIPGNIHNPQKSGCHHLIRQGATLVETPQQIMQDLQWQVENHRAQRNSVSPALSNANVPMPEGMNSEQYQVYKRLDYEGISLDGLLAITGLSVSQLGELLLDMELNNWVKQGQGLYFR